MKYVLALFAGAGIPLSLAPINFWPLGIFSIATWFFLLTKAREKELLVSWFFGLGKFGVGVSWIYVSIHEYGNASEILSSFLVLLFISALSFFPLLMALCYRSIRCQNDIVNAITFSSLFVLFEWSLTWALSGFPWLYPAYGHLGTSLSSFAPIGGVFLVSLALVVSACFGLLVFLRISTKTSIAVALLPWFAGIALKQIEWVQPNSIKTVALVQGNIDQSTKWLSENQIPISEKYQSLSSHHWDVDTMIWPEAAVTMFVHEAADLLAQLDYEAKISSTTLVLGIPAVDVLPGEGLSFRNTAMVLGTGSGIYVKRRLVPFGEYVPLESLLRGTIEFFDLPMSYGRPGNITQPLLQLDNAFAAMAICYEIVYPELVRKQAIGADVLITISNDSWFGASIGPFQHLEIARMRALENGRWLLRATNNGITGIVDHRGAIKSVMPQFEAGVLRDSYALMSGRTPFNKFGELPVLVLLLLLLVPSVYIRFLR